jgi:small subunit ribosomal protein S4
LYDSVRIGEENKLVDRYGLKNKREIWKVEAKVGYFRSRAKKLITAPTADQQAFFKKLQSIGLAVQSIADVLALTKEDLLKRRLTMILVQRGLATTPKHARQMIGHKRVTVGRGVVSAPGYLVPVHEEAHITLKKVKEKVKEASE